MVVATLEIEIVIPASESLKDKRQVVRSLIETIRGKFNVSAAEVEHQELWQRAGLGFAVVSADSDFAAKVLQKLIDAIDSDPRCEIVNIERDSY